MNESPCGHMCARLRIPWPALSLSLSILMALSFAWEPLKFKNREHPQKSRKHIFFIYYFFTKCVWRWRRSFSPERTSTDVDSLQINAMHNQNSLLAIVLQKRPAKLHLYSKSKLYSVSMERRWIFRV
jgi:hypothetical protein